VRFGRPACQLGGPTDETRAGPALNSDASPADKNRYAGCSRPSAAARLLAALSEEVPMKRVLAGLLLLAFGVSLAAPAFAARKTVVVHKNGSHHTTVVKTGPHRTTVVVHRGWPLTRPARLVVVHPAHARVRVTPVRYMAPVVFVPYVVALASFPPSQAIVWEGSEKLVRDDDWSEVTLNCNVSGDKLWLEVMAGSAQFDWAEVVYTNGDAQVVDFSEKTLRSSLYSLCDVPAGRRVDHVRLVARAKTDVAAVYLRMQK
jgi:hypothetical protein